MLWTVPRPKQALIWISRLFGSCHDVMGVRAYRPKDRTIGRLGTIGACLFEHWMAFQLFPMRRDRDSLFFTKHQQEKVVPDTKLLHSLFPSCCTSNSLEPRSEPQKWVGHGFLGGPLIELNLLWLLFSLLGATFLVQNARNHSLVDSSVQCLKGLWLCGQLKLSGAFSNCAERCRKGPS